MVSNALADQRLRVLVFIHAAPIVLRRVKDRRPIGFSEAIGVGNVKSRAFGGFKHRCRRCRAGGHDLNGMRQRAFLFFPGVDNKVENDGRTAEMCDLVFGDGIVNILGCDASQADIGPGERGDRPGERPAAAMKHRQSPEISRVMGHIPGHRAAECIEVGATVVIDDPLWVSGCTGGVAERQRLPLVVGQGPWMVRIAFGEKLFVFGFSQPVVARSQLIRDVDNHGFDGAFAQSLAHGRRKFCVRDDHLRLSVVEDEGDGVCVESDVDGIDHGSGCRDPEEPFVKRGDISRNHRHRIAFSDPPAFQRRRQLPAATEGIAPGVALSTMDHREALRVNRRGSRQPAQR